MVSINDNLISRLLIGNSMKEEQMHESETAVALDLMTETETQKLYERFATAARANPRGVLTSTDVQGWEYVNSVSIHYYPVSRWLEAMEIGSSAWMPHFEDDEMHVQAIVAKYFCSAHRVVQTEDGCLVVTPCGQVSSGELQTYTDSSFKRSVLSHIVARILRQPLTFCLSAGDDNIDTNAEASAIYRRLGFVVTDYVEQSKQFDFCSTVFEDQKAYQLNIDKFYVNLLFKATPNPALHAQLMVAFHSLFHKHPLYEVYLMKCVVAERLYRALPVTTQS